MKASPKVQATDRLKDKLVYKSGNSKEFQTAVKSSGIATAYLLVVLKVLMMGKSLEKLMVIQ